MRLQQGCHAQLPPRFSNSDELVSREGVRDRNRAEVEAANPAFGAGSAASVPARFQSRTPSSSHHKLGTVMVESL
eukprot:gene19538-biopygen6143